MPALPNTTTVGTELIQGITFQIDQGADDVLVGHCHIGDLSSGVVFGAVESDEGQGISSLRTRLSSLVDEIRDYCNDEKNKSAPAPDLVCLGSDYENPPKGGDQDNWAVVPAT